ncbi:hypothetical protein LY78DRAFT_655321 [Colletotrichum sublineola]|nr:hypothetical protein LY78DRAFT_655321 [Colletotrichum sublineola]
MECTNPHPTRRPFFLRRPPPQSAGFFRLSPWMSAWSSRNLANSPRLSCVRCVKSETRSRPPAKPVRNTCLCARALFQHSSTWPVFAGFARVQLQIAALLLDGFRAVYLQVTWTPFNKKKKKKEEEEEETKGHEEFRQPPGRPPRSSKPLRLLEVEVEKIREVQSTCRRNATIALAHPPALR